MISRDTLIRQRRSNRASWPSIVFVYIIIIAAMVLSGMAIT